MESTASTSSGNWNLEKIVENVAKTTNVEQLQKFVQDFYVHDNLIGLDKFYEGYDNAIKEINEEITPVKDKPSIEEFAELFKTFEEYPENMQKLKKTTPEKSQQQRFNNGTLSRHLSATTLASSLDVNSMSTSRVIQQQPTPMPPLQQQQQKPTPVVEDNNINLIPPAIETYRNFKLFRNKLEKINQQLSTKKQLLQEYEKKLRQFENFHQQMERFLTTDAEILPCLSVNESAALSKLHENVEELDDILNNREIFKQKCVMNARIESILDILSYVIKEIL